MTTVIFGAALSSPAMARDMVPSLGEERPALRATYAPASPPAPADLPEPIRAMMAASDRGSPRTERSHEFAGSFGAFDLTAFTSRFRGSAPGMTTDRYRARAAGFAVSTELLDGLGFRSEIMLTTIRRGLGGVPIGYRARSTASAVFGAGLALDGGPALMLGYVRTDARGRSGAERMVEIAGGAPMAGHGPRLALSGGARAGQAGRIGWSLSAASMRRPADEMGLGAVTRGFTDNRAELALRMAF